MLEEETGKLFPAADRSRVVRDALVDLARDRRVEWLGDTQVTAMRPDDHRWELLTADGRRILADAVIVATGGLSVPATGSDGFGLQQLGLLGHTIRPTYPALTPITLDPPEFADLAGLSLNVTITAIGANERREARGGFLFVYTGDTADHRYSTCRTSRSATGSPVPNRRNSASSGLRWTATPGRRCSPRRRLQSQPWCAIISPPASPIDCSRSPKFQEAPYWHSFHDGPGFG